MNYKIPKLVIILLTIVVLLALALPEFKFEVKGKNFRYPSIGFSRIGIPQDFGSFKRSKDIFSSTKVRAQIQFEGDTAAETASNVAPISDEEKTKAQEKILKMVKERANYVGLYNIDIYSEYASTGEYYITYIIPEDFTNPVSVANWLSLQGEFSFNKSFTQNIDIKDYDIEDGITVSSVIGLAANSGKQYLTQNNLKFEVSQSKSTEYHTLFDQTSEENSGAYMFIDGSPVFSLYSDTTDVDKLTVRAIPLELSDDDGKLFITIVKSLFSQSEKLPYSLKIDSETQSDVIAGFNPKGGTFISVSFIVSSILVLALFFYNFKFKGAVITGLLMSLQVLGLVTLLKFFNASLSLGLIIGFIFSLILFTKLNWELLQEHFDDSHKLISNVKNTNILLLITFVAFVRLGLNLSSFNDAMGVVLLFSAINIGYSFVYYPFIIQFYHNFNLRTK